MIKGKNANRCFTLLLALCMLLMLLSGCADNADDILATVGETPVYRWYFDAYLTQQLALFESYYGKDLATSGNSEEYLNYKKYRLDDLLGEAAILEKARTLGIANLTAEQEAEIDQQYLTYYNSVITAYTDEHGTGDANLRKAEQAFDQLLKDSGLTPERVRETIRNGYITNLYKEHEGLVAEFTEEDLKAQYDSLLLSQQQSLDNNPLLFVQQPAPVPVYIPDGYKKTFRLIKYYSDQQMDDIVAAGESLTASQNAYMLAVLEGGNDSAAAKSKMADYEKAQAVYANIIERIRSSVVNNKLDTVIDRLNNGEDFKTVMEQETDDEQIATYYIREGVDTVEEPYLTAALTLTEPGSYTEPVAVDEGVCLIYLDEIMQAGPIPFEEVRDAIEKDMNNSSTFQTGVNTGAQLLQEAEAQGIVEVHYDLLEK